MFYDFLLFSLTVFYSNLNIEGLIIPIIQYKFII